MRSVSGVRGIIGEDVTPDLVRRYAYAFASLVGGDVVIGWDSRPGGLALKDAAVSGVTSAGVVAHDIGVSPTPTVGIAVRRLGLTGGISVTASHNPEEYDGLKFFSARGALLSSDAMSRLFESVESADPPSGGGRDPVAVAGAARWHVEAVLASEFVDAVAIRRAGLRVVVDCVNAAGALVLPLVLRELGCDLEEIYTDVGAGFPRGPEPVAGNLSELGNAVRELGAHAGFACDPDADRLALVDEHGTPVGEEYTLAIATRTVLSRRRGPVVVNVSTSRMIEDVSGEFGVSVRRTPVGEVNVVAGMDEIGAVVGGEGNGGVILPSVHPGRDAATGAGLVATAIAATPGRHLSELVDSLPRYAMSKRRIRRDEASLDGIVAAMRSAFPDARLETTDGAKMCWPGRWVHARISGTEPVIRIIAEASDADEAEALACRAAAALEA